MAKLEKIRLDELLVQRGLCENRSQARALILAGSVLVGDVPVTKAGTLVNLKAVIRDKDKPKYVSRGGIKLEAALREFQVNVNDKICLDIGASTGGFTDCLLKHGAKKVYAVDVGYGQMNWSLQSDAKVVRFDRENFRNFDLNKLHDTIDVIVMDVSFISARLLIPKIKEVGAPANIILFKPQFEVGPAHVGKGGIVRDVAVREKALLDFENFLTAEGFLEIKTIPSPITGTDGNVEYLIFSSYHAPHKM